MASGGEMMEAITFATLAQIILLLVGFVGGQFMDSFVGKMGGFTLHEPWASMLATPMMMWNWFYVLIGVFSLILWAWVAKVAIWRTEGISEW